MAGSEFEENLFKSGHRHLRVVKLEIPTDEHPDTYQGFVSGYRIVTGDTFRVQLSNGVFVTAQ